jgi:sigma-B regulation protein RsbU (phosphoserine phosphatase)
LSESVPLEDLEDLYEHAPCGYISLSRDARIVKVNSTMSGWLGLPASSVLGRPFHDLLTFGGRIAYETHLAPLLRLQGTVEEIALDFFHADGSKIPVFANAAEKRGEAGEHQFTRLTLFKSVDRRTYERNLLESLNTAEQAFAAEHQAAVLREQFIAVLGHDLRNPLAAIAVGVDMLQKREALSDRGTRVVQEMLAATRRASALIENVLDFARSKLGGGMDLSLESEIDLAPVLQQIVDEVRAVSPDRDIRADYALERPVTCDPVKIGQLAANLLANAVTHGAPDRPITLEARTKGAELELAVANAGPPIDEAARRELFQPFFRGSNRRSRNGLGLGLYIVSEIAKAHGGAIDVDSSEEETRFTLRMPVDG